MHELDPIALFPSVTALNLENNPLQNQAKDFATYASDVRKVFPNLERLVGIVHVYTVHVHTMGNEHF